jgi:5'-methylthioadenosine phosphorylase
MTARMGCLAGPAIYRLRQQGKFQVHPLGSRPTPFGLSEMVFEVADAEAPFYLICPHGADGYERSDSFVNHRANLYAFKDLGVSNVLAFTAVGTVSHNYNIGDLVLLSDVIDQTTRRASTFFEGAGVGVMRQFPVFCPDMQKAMAAHLGGMRCRHHEAGTLVVTEGPRLETAAEVRFYAAAGGQLVSHALAPDVFLARELELCFGGIAYVANFAETGSSYRPYSAEGLFGESLMTDETRLEHAVDLLGELIRRVSRTVAGECAGCCCGHSMRERVQRFGLPADWRQWFVPREQPPRMGGWSPTSDAFGPLPKATV